jgi:hypothetical protein
VEKYGRVGQTTDDTIIWRKRFASWQIKATDTHSEYIILIAFHCNKRYCASVLRLRTLPILFTTVLNSTLLPVPQHRITSTTHACLVVIKSCLLCVPRWHLTAGRIHHVGCVVCLMIICFVLKAQVFLQARVIPQREHSV